MVSGITAQQMVLSLGIKHTNIEGCPDASDSLLLQRSIHTIHHPPHCIRSKTRLPTQATYQITPLHSLGKVVPLTLVSEIDVHYALSLDVEIAIAFHSASPRNSSPLRLAIPFYETHVSTGCHGMHCMEGHKTCPCDSLECHGIIKSCPQRCKLTKSKMNRTVGYPILW